MAWIFKTIEFKLRAINSLQPFVNLGVRFWIANIFLKSAILKLPAGFLGFGKGNWNSTLYLFREEHPVPLLSPEIAAFIGTSFELICPILLILGLGTRSAAAILLLMTAFIEITYFQATDHLHWMILCAFLICYGGGKFSLDYTIRKKSLACDKYRKMAGI